MAKARGMPPVSAPRLTNGPGKLTEALSITRADNGVNLTDSTLSLYLAEDDFARPRIVATTRVGITKAAHLKLRYLVPDNPFVSRP